MSSSANHVKVLHTCNACCSTIGPVVRSIFRQWPDLLPRHHFQFVSFLFCPSLTLKCVEEKTLDSRYKTISDIRENFWLNKTHKTICEIDELVRVDSVMASAITARIELAKLCSLRNWSKAIRILDSLLAQSYEIQDIWSVSLNYNSFPILPLRIFNFCCLLIESSCDVKNVDYCLVTAIEHFVTVNWSYTSTWLGTVTRRFSLILRCFKLIFSKVSIYIMCRWTHSSW